MNQKDDQKLMRLRQLAHLLDTKFEGPFGIRFGLDALLGLIPVVGDVSTTIMAFIILSQASARGCSSATLFRMALNIFFENLVDSIPIFGNIFDFYFKANVRNMKLLEQHLRNPKAVTVKSTFTLVLIALFLLGSLVLTGYGAFKLLQAIFN